jgi:N-carbamoylputrescine amidase
MSMMVNVALLQMVGNGTDQAANLRKGEAFCRQAKAQGADIALFPEMWNIAYPFIPNIRSFRSR